MFGKELKKELELELVPLKNLGTRTGTSSYLYGRTGTRTSSFEGGTLNRLRLLAPEWLLSSVSRLMCSQVT